MFIDHEDLEPRRTRSGLASRPLRSFSNRGSKHRAGTNSFQCLRTPRRKWRPVPRSAPAAVASSTMAKRRHSRQHRPILDAGHDLFGEELHAPGPIVIKLDGEAIDRPSLCANLTIRPRPGAADRFDME